MVSVALDVGGAQRVGVPGALFELRGYLAGGLDGHGVSVSLSILSYLLVYLVALFLVFGPALVVYAVALAGVSVYLPAASCV